MRLSVLLKDGIERQNVELLIVCVDGDSRVASTGTF